MKNKPIRQQAVMTVDEGEELAEGWVTQIGIYKLLAKKKADGTFEWAHFVQRDSGLRARSSTKCSRPSTGHSNASTASLCCRRKPTCPAWMESRRRRPFTRFRIKK